MTCCGEGDITAKIIDTYINHNVYNYMYRPFWIIELVGAIFCLTFILFIKMNIKHKMRSR